MINVPLFLWAAYSGPKPIYMRASKDSVVNREKVRQLASANIRFETKKKEQENRALSAQVELKNTSIRVYIVAGIGVLLLAVIGWFIMCHRGQYMLHRLIGKQGTSFRFCGDGNCGQVEIVSPEHILGIL